MLKVNSRSDVDTARPFDNITAYLSQLEDRINSLEAQFMKGAAPATDDQAPIGVEEASKLLRLSQSRVYVLSKEGKLPCHRRGGRLYFFRDEIHRLIRGSDDTVKVIRQNKKAVAL